MKIRCAALLFLFLSSSLYSQKTIWGTVENGGLYDNGYLYRTDSIGNSLTIVHHFNGTDDGKFPGAVMQASNGKLYGLTSQGGHGVVFLMNHPNLGPLYTMGGTLYEYDPVIDSFRVLIHFNSTDPQYPTGFDSPSPMKLLEVSPGNLWCVFNIRENHNSVIQALPRYIMSYQVNPGLLAPVVMVPSWASTGYPTTQYTHLTGGLYKAANGMVYGPTAGYATCATTAAISVGSFISIDPLSHAFSWVSPLACSGTSGNLMQGQLENVSGKLYSYTYWGGAYTVYPANGYGTIYEYDPVSNLNVKKYDFQGGINGQWPLGRQLLANNGKLYGTTQGGTPVQNFPNGSGMIYEFDPATGAYAKKADFVHGYTIADMGSQGSIWMKSSGNGKLYGTTQKGLFEYNTLNNQIRIAARFNAPLANALAHELTEVCRMPAYKPLAVSSYSLCAGTGFTLNLNCGNATSVVWKHNGNAEPSYISPVLAMSQVALSDGGTWVCELTNACGTTTAQAISLTVNPSGTGVSTSTISPAGHLHICPGSSLTLSGNVNGNWNTGSTAPSLVVSAPGAYQVTNTNACGHTFSNSVLVDTIPTPIVPVVTFSTSGSYLGPILSQSVCPGDSALLLGNYPGGMWSSGETTASIYVKDLNPRYITVNNGCLTVLSATAQLSFFAVQVPSVTAIGSLTICAGDSIRLVASGGGNTGYNWYHDNGFSNSYVGYGNYYEAKQTGNYYIRQNPYCGPVYSQTIHVDASGTALGPAIITPLGSTVICQGSSVVLQSNYASCTWNTGATTQTILATGAGPYSVTNHNSCSSVSSAPLTLSVTPAPAVSFLQAPNTLCFTSGTVTLSPGSPSGGYYSGPGVSGATFDPVLAGAGAHTISYSVYDAATGCTGQALQNIQVEGNPVVSVAGPTLVCQGINAVLYQDTPVGIWNTGASGLILATLQTGSYYVTRLNACGVSVTSNTVQIAHKPAPAINVSGISSLCSGYTASLSASGGTSYTWTPGGTSQHITVSPSSTTVYTVLSTGSNGCYGYGYHTLTVNPLPLISVPGATICRGASHILQASGAVTYTWSNAQNGSSITVSPTVSSVYQVTGTDQNLCVNTAGATVTVNAPPPAPLISLNGQVLQSTPANSYQWYLNGSPLPGATSSTCSVTQNGNYTVEITDANGCTALSAAFPVVDTALDKNAPDAGISIFPNPGSGHFILRLPLHEIIQIRICNLLGQTILTDSSRGLPEHTMQIAESGVYLIELIWNGRSHVQKLVVQTE